MEYVKNLDNKAKLVRDLFRSVNLSIIDIIYDMNFNDPQKVEQLFFGRLDEDLFMREFMRYFKSLSPKEQKQLLRNMDRRTPYDFYRNMVIGWVTEAGIHKFFMNSGILLIDNDNTVIIKGKKVNRKKKYIFDRNHIAKLDFKVGSLLLELQETLYPFKFSGGYYSFMTKPWKVKKLSVFNSYLININLPNRIASVTHIFDYLKSYVVKENYYGPGKPGYLFHIPVDKDELSKALEDNYYYCNGIHSCVAEFKNLPVILYNLYNIFMELKLNNKLKYQKQIVKY